MGRLIDANALVPDTSFFDGGDWHYGYSAKQLEAAPTVDAVPVPCYVGDEIWYVPDYNKKPFRAVCHCISIDKGGVRIHLYDMDGDNATLPARCVFKSKEDAERYCSDGGRGV
jgi:hypothetical protein